MELAEKLKKCRQIHHLTQSEVALNLNVSRKTISGWENSRSFPDISSLVRLSDLYNISLDDLLRDNHLLKEYALLTKREKVSNNISKITYCLNLLFCLLGYVEFFYFKSPHIPIIPMLLVANLIIFLTHYPDWSKFKKRSFIFKFLLTFVFLFLCNLLFSLLLLALLTSLSSSDIYFLLGFAFGKLLLLFIISISLEVIIFLKPNTLAYAHRA
ncbi:MAG: helix-turn-helix transcriptional regulator [Liquorilactobacillus ghanensis]|uniref:helix-turn-helix domain-containing protein n=1 Tax=Liquorilactobacillus ghanensis TaxID=399370 RepID=UPI0039EC0249